MVVAVAIAASVGGAVALPASVGGDGCCRGRWWCWLKFPLVLVVTVAIASFGGPCSPMVVVALALWCGWEFGVVALATHFCKINM